MVNYSLTSFECKILSIFSYEARCSGTPLVQLRRIDIDLGFDIAHLVRVAFVSQVLFSQNWAICDHRPLSLQVFAFGAMAWVFRYSRARECGYQLSLRERFC